jgi:hypothetical protein
LPGEIREKIFGYVVGGESIHVTLNSPANDHYYSRHESRYRLNLCPRPEPLTDPSTPRAREILAIRIEEESPFTERHYRCCLTPNQPVNEALSLDFLVTCRQIYKEACLLPFKSNSFLVEFGLGRESIFPPGVNVLEAFIGTLAPQQRDSVKHLVLVSRDFNRDDGVQIERLRGLASLQIVHTHLSGHKDSEDWPDDNAFTWGPWSRSINMPLLKIVRHTAELQQEDCGICPEGCWDPEAIYRIDRILRDWEFGLLDCARESRLEVIGGERKVPQRRDSACWMDSENNGDDGEEDDDDWNDECDASCESLKNCAGIDELRRLGLIRLHLPRDGARARDAMLFVMDGRVREA